MKNLLPLIIFALFLSCNEDPLAPPPLTLPDTTSHNIVWEVDTLGDDFSRLFGIWGTSPKNMWAVGWIKSSGWGSNIIRFDGEKWHEYEYYEADLRSVYGFGENDIWAVGSNLNISEFFALIAHYNGNEWKTVHVAEGVPSLSKIWGNSSSDIFAVGLEGTIMHFNGSYWTKMESGVTGMLTDVWGSGPNNVYACGTDQEGLANPVLLHYDGIEWKNILDESAPQGHKVESVWGNSYSDVYFRSSYGLFKGNLKNGWNKIIIPDDNTAMTQIHGSSLNNIFMVGHFSIILHFNGNSWYRYDQIFEKPGGDTFWSVYTFPEHVFIAGNGFDLKKALVYRGKIQN